MSASQPVVLLPGLLNDGRVFAPQLEALRGRGTFQVADLTRDDSIAAMARSVLAAAPPRFALAGFSMGGYVALEIMRQAAARVTRLALLGSSARADSPAQREMREAQLRQVAVGTFKGITGRLLPMLIHPDRVNDAALVGTIQAMALDVGKEGFLRQQRAILGRSDSRELLPGIAVPTLVLCGRQDRRAPLDHSEELAASIPGARLVVAEQCGHVVPLERPEVVNDALGAWLG